MSILICILLNISSKTCSMSSLSLLISVRQYLASHHMFVVEDWLSGCVEYLSDDSENNYSETEIKNLAKEQWLLNDLREICPGSLPANLKNQPKTTLDGRFVLQINAAIDIGTPAYQQYLKLQRVNMENIEATTNYEDKVPSHRMIKLYLTDGVQEVTAIEYKQMRNLSCEITPGCKALIKGPIECRRGMLLLTESAIELLGGEVQEIAISHSLAGQLCTKLGLPMTQERDLNTTISVPRNTNIPIPHTEMPPAYDPPPPAYNQQASTYNQPPPTYQQCQNIDEPSNFADDEIDVDQLAALEEQIVDLPGKRPLESISTNPEKKLKTDTINQSNDYPEDADLFLAEDEDYLREIEAQIETGNINSNTPQKTGPNNVSAEPFVYIKQIKDLNKEDTAGKIFKVKAQIMSLLSKLSVGKDGWSLKCTIVDGTGSLDVEFTSDVLSKLVGFTPQEMTALKKQMATKPELKEKAISALQKAKDSLQVLCCIIELTILEVPKITNLIPFSATHIDQLNSRANNS